MVQVGLLMSDIPKTVSPAQQFSDILRVVEAAQEAGFTYISFGQHFLYGDLSYLQPSRCWPGSPHVEPHIRLVTSVIMRSTTPVMLAEELATLDVVTEGPTDLQGRDRLPLASSTTSRSRSRSAPPAPMRAWTSSSGSGPRTR